MEILISICDSEERSWQKAESISWLREQIGARQSENIPVYVVVKVVDRGVCDLTFVCGECNGSGGGGGVKSYTREELRVIECWKALGADKGIVDPDRLISFFLKVSEF
tara:strand:+ start:686 stop:1009 length:324 start_codon:yes stop_codon:yes gene_type:complete